jgi:putative NADH-flavin reductase
MVQHFREWWLFGLFFAIVTPLQLVWALMVWRHPSDRRLLWIGAGGNLAVAGVWAASRVVGLPFGPETFRPETVGFKDVLATADELSIAVLLALLLLREGERSGTRWLQGGAWILVGASVLGSSIAGH